MLVLHVNSEIVKARRDLQQATKIAQQRGDRHVYRQA
jgi:hypothetical protein